MLRKVLFLDRDGIVNVDHGYVYKPEEFEFMPGIFSLCHTAITLGYELVVVTNQSGIGRGYYSEAQFNSLTQWMTSQFTEHKVPLLGVYFCPHHPDNAQGNFRQACDCRKPEPGMLLKAASDLGIDLAHSVMLGDKVSDMQAAQRAGLKYAWLLSQDEKELSKLSNSIRPENFLVTPVKSLQEVEASLLASVV